MTDGNMITYIDLDRLPLYAENVAKSISPAGEMDAARSARELSRILNQLKKICLYAERYSRTAIKIPTEVEWLIDNRYIAEREAKGVIADLKRAKKLPKRAGKAYPVIYEAAFYLVHSGKRDPEKAEIFPLRISERPVHRKDFLFLSHVMLALFPSRETAGDCLMLYARCRRRDKPFCPRTWENRKRENYPA
jgi:cyclic beta-1,2-glucan synthetase